MSAGASTAGLRGGRDALLTAWQDIDGHYRHLTRVPSGEQGTLPEPFALAPDTGECWVRAVVSGLSSVWPPVPSPTARPGCEIADSFARVEPRLRRCPAGLAPDRRGHRSGVAHHVRTTSAPCHLRPYDDLVSWRRLDTGAGHLAIRLWLHGAGIPAAIDAAFADLAGCDPLVLDLRGNVGGNYLLALDTRDRFLRTGTTLGTVRHTIGGGRLADPLPITGEPSRYRRWPGNLVVLTDPLTYSANEDLLLGLAGLTGPDTASRVPVSRSTCHGRPSGRPTIRSGTRR